MGNTLHDKGKELRIQKRELYGLQDSLGALEHKMNMEAKTTCMLVFDDILDLRKNMNQFVRAEEN